MPGHPGSFIAPRHIPEPEDAVDAEYMEVEPPAESGPLYESEYDDEPPSHGKRRFVGGFIRGLKKLPRAMARGFVPGRRDVQTPPGLEYHNSPYQSPYISGAPTQEPEDVPPYDSSGDPIDGEPHYVEGMQMPVEHLSPRSRTPSHTPSHTIRAPRSESQLTYQSLTNPSIRYISQHGSVHRDRRSSPPRTVRNPDSESPTGSGAGRGDSMQFSQSDHDPSRRSPLEPTRRPTVTVQSPTGSPVYIEPEQAEDYAGMEPPAMPEPEPSGPSQLKRIGKFFRDLKDLPWTSPNVAVDFDPAKSERSRYVRSPGSGRSWYTGQITDLDLLGGPSMRRPAGASAHPPGHASGSGATLAPRHGSGSASSSEAASAHLPAPHSHPPPYFYPVSQLTLPHPQPLFFYPTAYPAMMPPRPPPGSEQPSPQSSGGGYSEVPLQQPYVYMVAMPPGYVGGPPDPSRPTPHTAYGVPYPPPV
ncbi:hypothetical protein BC834DRAFT_847420 [Gloeopeniophorella convolvens]|nr:hypothetical protein BC834DRAFT_847420 [Gloeopeniophorella convolvens]